MAIFQSVSPFGTRNQFSHQKHFHLYNGKSVPSTKHGKPIFQWENGEKKTKKPSKASSSSFFHALIRLVVIADGLLHTVCGTPAYVEPEMLAKKGYDGAKVDVWSCGVILFVLTTGYLLFNNHNLAAMYRKIYRGRFRFPRWTSPELRHLLCRLPLEDCTIERWTYDDGYVI